MIDDAFLRGRHCSLCMEKGHDIESVPLQSAESRSSLCDG